MNRDIDTEAAPGEFSWTGDYGAMGKLFSQAGLMVNRFYWQQKFNVNNSAMAAGRLDPTDVQDILGYANP